MTSLTDSDLKEIKDAIVALSKQINDVEKNLTQKINDVEKNLSELSGEVKATNVKIVGLDKRMTDGLNNLDKRVATQEFIHRAVFIAIISLLTTGAISTLGTSAIKYFWNHPLFPVN